MLGHTNRLLLLASLQFLNLLLGHTNRLIACLHFLKQIHNWDYLVLSSLTLLGIEIQIQQAFTWSSESWSPSISFPIFLKVLLILT